MSYKKTKRKLHKDERYGNFRNKEGYSDPTVGNAMKNLSKWKPRYHPHRC